LDVTHAAALFQSEEALAEQIARGFACQGLEVRLAIADTLGAAWALAHFEVPGTQEETPYPANETSSSQVANEVPASLPAENMAPDHLPGRVSNHRPGAVFQAPRPLLVFVGGSASCIPPAALLRLPVAALRLPEVTIALLHELGLTTIGQLTELPRPGLAARLGALVLERLDQALGLRPEAIVSHRAPPPAAARWSAESPVERLEILEAATRRLLEQLLAQLDQPTGPARGGRQGIEQLGCKFRSLRGETQFALGLFRPTADVRHLWELIRLKLEALRSIAGVETIELEVQAAGPLPWRQRLLFDAPAHDGQRQLAWLMNRLSSRLGAEQVVRAGLQPDAQPEHAYRYEPLVNWGMRNQDRAPQGLPRRSQTSVPRRGKKPQAKQPAISQAALAWPSPLHGLPSAEGFQLHFRRPLRLLARPRPVEIVALSAGGWPERFVIHDAAHAVPHAIEQRTCQAVGPERIETGWWRSRMVRRDYYRLLTADGWLWLFRRLQDEKWFLHGWFA
jgi:protein ImuB